MGNYGLFSVAVFGIMTVLFGRNTKEHYEISLYTMVLAFMASLYGGSDILALLIIAVGVVFLFIRKKPKKEMIVPEKEPQKQKRNPSKKYKGTRHKRVRRGNR